MKLSAYARSSSSTNDSQRHTTIFRFEDGIRLPEPTADASLEMAKSGIRPSRFGSDRVEGVALPGDNLPKQDTTGLEPVAPNAPKLAEAIQHLVSLPSTKGSTSGLHALQEWEGYVTEIADRDFCARLVDVTAGSVIEEEEARIPLAELSDYDIRNMRLGSVFHWVIGYERSPSGTKKRVSEFVFRNLPVLTEQDVLDGQAWAARVIASLDQ